MSAPRTTFVLLMSAALVACSAAPAAPSSRTPMVTAPPPTAPIATVAPSSAPAEPPSPEATPMPTPMPTKVPKSPKPTKDPVPPKPTGVTFDVSTKCVLGEDADFDCIAPDEDTAPEYIVTDTVTWKAPRTKGLEVRVYGITECLARPAKPKPGTGGPCVVKGTKLPAAVRTLLATAPASRGTVSWSWTQDDGGCDIYPEGWPLGDPAGTVYVAIVVAAFNEAGPSVYAIAEPGGWSELGPGDMPC